MFCDPNHKPPFIYLALPKTGSYSIHYFFGYIHNHPEPNLHHIGIRDLLDIQPTWKDYFSFGFVRNPWSKLWSAYYDLKFRRVKQYSEKVKVEKPLLSEFENFKDFCVRLKDSRWKDDIFFRPQISFVKKKDGKLVDFIGKFESINSDFASVCKILNIDFVPPLGIANRGEYVGGYHEQYDADSILAVSDLYQEDIDTFGYKF